MGSIDESTHEIRFGVAELVLEDLAGFAPIPVRRIGLVNDEYRPVQRGPD